MRADELVRAFQPNRAINRRTWLLLVTVWVVALFVVWMTTPYASIPKPRELWTALGSLWWEHGMGPEMGTTLKLITHSLFLTVVISLGLSYATVIPFFRPLVAGLSKLRFLGITVA
jgi:NitT/TauT family transport system permease protein